MLRETLTNHTFSGPIMRRAGIAAFEFVHTLKKNGFSGKIILLTDEDLEPYDRTKLSKVCNDGESVMDIH